MFRGIFVGILMTVGGVYGANSMADGSTRPIVNWDVAIAKSIDAANSIRQHLARLIDQAREAPSAPDESSQ